MSTQFRGKRGDRMIIEIISPVVIFAIGTVVLSIIRELKRK